jgi:hypothetical protein
MSDTPDEPVQTPDPEAPTEELAAPPTEVPQPETQPPIPDTLTTDVPPEPTPEPVPAKSETAAPLPAPAPAQETFEPAHPSPPASSKFPPAVLALSDTELKAAAALFAQRHQRENSRKGVEARQDRMRQNLEIVIARVRHHGTVQIPRLTQDLDMSPGLVSNYLLILLKQGKVKATGHGASRRYSVT